MEQQTLILPVLLGHQFYYHNFDHSNHDDDDIRNCVVLDLASLQWMPLQCESQLDWICKVPKGKKGKNPCREDRVGKSEVVRTNGENTASHQWVSVYFSDSVSFSLAAPHQVASSKHSNQAPQGSLFGFCQQALAAFSSRHGATSGSLLSHPFQG